MRVRAGSSRSSRGRPGAHFAQAFFPGLDRGAHDRLNIGEGTVEPFAPMVKPSRAQRLMQALFGPPELELVEPRGERQAHVVRVADLHTLHPNSGVIGDPNLDEGPALDCVQEAMPLHQDVLSGSPTGKIT